MHLARKLFHASGILVVLVYRGADLERQLAATLLWAIVVLLLLIDLLRAFRPAFQERFQAMFFRILDKKDQEGLNGSTLYFAGCALSVTLLPVNPACAGILALALGDPAAAIVGSSVRSPRIGRVSLAGSGACLLFATAACAIFYPLGLALVGGVAATALEAGSGTKLDNLTIPLGVAAVMHLL